MKNVKIAHANTYCFNLVLNTYLVYIFFTYMKLYPAKLTKFLNMEATFTFFTSNGERTERSLRKSQVTAQRLAMMFKVSIK